MRFAHISDTHLGLVQYGSDEREQDMYDAFNQAIDASIGRGVGFVIFAGDIFDSPSPSGDAIVVMANGLKRLKEAGIDSFFVLGEHDISRVRRTPVPYVYHNLDFSRYIGDGRPFVHRGVLICGFDKIRRSEMPQYAERLAEADRAAAGHRGHRILVMHQGIGEFNEFAGEIRSTEMPRNFTYYAMGHLHDGGEREFAHLGGPVVYPGSTELTPSEGIKEARKGFYIVDISGEKARAERVGLDTRPQLAIETDYEGLSRKVEEISERISGMAKKPVVKISVSGENIDADSVQAQVSRLDQSALRNTWSVSQAAAPDSSVLPERPRVVEDEMLRLAADALGSEERAGFAVKRLLPALASGDTERAVDVIDEEFERTREAAG